MLEELAQIDLGIQQIAVPDVLPRGAVLLRPPHLLPHEALLLRSLYHLLPHPSLLLTYTKNTSKLVQCTSSTAQSPKKEHAAQENKRLFALYPNTGFDR